MLMISQDGKLVLILKGHRGKDDFGVGTYFLVRQFKEVLRFDSTEGILEMNVMAEDWNKTLDIAMFKRRGRTKNDLRGTRRRDLIDITSISLTKLEPNEVMNNEVRWTNLEANLLVAGITIYLDIEFYALSAPLKPWRVKTQVNQQLASYGHHGKKITKEIQQTTRDLKDKSKIKRGLQGLLPIWNSKRGIRKVDLTGSDDVIYDHVIRFGEAKSKGGSREYIHATETVNLPSIDTNSVYEFIRKNKEMKYDDDTLPIENEPRNILKDATTRLVLGEKLSFSTFPSTNVRFTGYIGNGKWCKPQVGFFNRAAYIFSRPSLPPPTLPPKCPKGMLWEEYYILEKDKYIRDISPK